MNKQGKEDKKTTCTNVRNTSLLSVFFSFKCSKSVRDKFAINVHAVTILVACYCYSVNVNSIFTINKIALFNYTYSHARVRKYFDVLVSKGLITQSGMKKYILTDTGMQAIEEISQSSESLIYEFCSKYGIEL